MCECRWNPANAVPGASNLFIQMMDAVNPVNPTMLYLIQGPNQVTATQLSSEGREWEICLLQGSQVRTAQFRGGCHVRGPEIRVCLLGHILARFKRLFGYHSHSHDCEHTTLPAILVLFV